ncbi:MAG: polysaccharide export protein [Desulfobacterales bacterium]|jgi:polysaccharide export outer membrane protein|nr:polysaccharide export protein [Desulfobacterales bacterium]
MKSKRLLVSVAAAVVFLSLCQAASSQSQPVQTWSAKSQSAEYRIGAGDVLEISTWKEPELSRPAVLVRIDGRVSFPLLGDIAAAGMTPMQLTETIQKGLASYVTAPVVTVTVVNPASQRIYVLGEVMRTGEYPLTKELTVLQAFSLAGGFTQWASKDAIILMRKEGGKEKIYRINYKDIVKGKDIENNITLQTNDTIVVP